MHNLNAIVREDLTNHQGQSNEEDHQSDQDLQNGCQDEAPAGQQRPSKEINRENKGSKKSNKLDTSRHFDNVSLTWPNDILSMEKSRSIKALFLRIKSGSLKDVSQAVVFEQQAESIFYEKPVTDLIIIQGDKKKEFLSLELDKSRIRNNVVTRPRTRSSSGCRLCVKTLNPSKQHPTAESNKLCSRDRQSQIESGSRTTSSTSSRRGTLSTNVSVETNHSELKSIDSQKLNMGRTGEIRTSLKNNPVWKALDDKHQSHQIDDAVPNEIKDDAKMNVKRVPTQELDIEDRILKRREMSHLFQWYYPEGGWGWIILFCAIVSMSFAHGLQWSFTYPFGAHVRRRFQIYHDTGNSTDGNVEDSKGPVGTFEIGCLTGMSLSFSMLFSPLVTLFCRKKSARLAAVVGGLVLGLGVLFTSFANEFNQLYFSYGTVIALGVTLIHDSSTVMLGHYFKKKREIIEVFFCSTNGIGIIVVAISASEILRAYSWRKGLQVISISCSLAFILGTFYRSATMYHPQRRAILHLKSQRRKVLETNISRNEATNSVIDLRAYKSRAIHTAFLAAVFGSLIVYSPIVYLPQHGFDEGMSSTDLLWLQVMLGIGWIIGCFLFGLLIVVKPRGCRLSRIYMNATCSVICGLTTFVFPSLEGSYSHNLFALVYGTFAGGFNYTFKMHLFEMAKSRHFALVWSFVQLVQSVGIGIGIPCFGYVSKSPICQSLFGMFLLASALTLFFGDKWRHMRRSHKCPLHPDKEISMNPDENLGLIKPMRNSVKESKPYDIKSFYDEFDCEDEDDDEAKESIWQNFPFNGIPKHDENDALWEQIENEIFCPDKINEPKNKPTLPDTQQPINGHGEVIQDTSLDIPLEENVTNFEQTEKNEPKQFPKSKPQRLWRQSTEDFYLSTSSSGHTTSSGSSAGQLANLQPQYGMSAALSAAMFVTASTALPRSDHLGPGSNFKSKEIPTFNTIGKMKNSMHQRRSITVIEEVSA